MTNQIKKQIELKAPLARVWQALTDYREFGEWFRVRLEGPFIVGKETRGRITYPGYEHINWVATVTAIEPETRFAFEWHPYAIESGADYSAEPPTLVEFRLEPTPAGTLLTVTESGFDALPAGRRTEAFRMNDNGWAIQMTNIEAYVGSHP